jgi:hypothetical protein
MGRLLVNVRGPTEALAAGKGGAHINATHGHTVDSFKAALWRWRKGELRARARWSRGQWTL